MYESSNISYVGAKYVPLIMGIIFLTIAFWIMIDPTFEITVNGVRRNAVFSDSYFLLILGTILVLLFLIIG